MQHCMTPTRAPLALDKTLKQSHMLPMAVAASHAMPIPPPPPPCIDLTRTLQAVAIPPTPLSSMLGARIEHITPTVDDSLLSTTIAQQLSLPHDFVHALLHFGAVYYCPVHPPPPRGLPDANAQRVHAIRSASLAHLGRTPHPGEQVPRRMVADCIVEPWSYVRVHLHPKRFPMAYDVDWKARVLLHNDACVVLNKPPGVSVVPRVDNCIECCTHLTAQALGLSTPLLATHRLDTYTEGVLVMATAPHHVQWFHDMLGGQQQGGGGEVGEVGGDGGAGEEKRRKKREKKEKKKALMMQKAAQMMQAAAGGADGDTSTSAGVGDGGDSSNSMHTHNPSSQDSMQTHTAPAAAPPQRVVTKVYRTLTAAPPPRMGVWRDLAWVNVCLQGLPSFTIMLPDEGGGEGGEDDMGGEGGEGGMGGEGVKHGGNMGGDGGEGGEDVTHRHYAAATTRQIITTTTPKPITTTTPQPTPPTLYGKPGQPALLEVLQCTPVELTGPAAARWGPCAYESHVRLITGRTHQIRAQFAARGVPLLGDPLYAMLHGLVHENDSWGDGRDVCGPEEVVARVQAAHAAFKKQGLTMGLTETDGLTKGLTETDELTGCDEARHRDIGDGNVHESNGHAPESNGHAPESNGHAPESNGHAPESNGHAPESCNTQQQPRATTQQPPAGTPRVLQDAQDAMGLQSWQLHVHVEGPLGGPCVLEAGVPWWRAQVHAEGGGE